MNIAPLRAVLPDAALVASAETFFSVVKHDYLDYRGRGMFRDADDEGVYVYDLREAGRRYLGLVATLPPEAYRDGRIKRHEGTLAASEQQQLQLLVLRGAVVKPVLLTYPGGADVDALLEEIARAYPPTLLLDGDDDVQHRLFRVAMDTTYGQRLRQAYAAIDHVYIADGHHRCSTLDLYNRRRESRGEAAAPLLAALFSSAQVRVNPFHRVLHLPVDLSPLALVAQLSEVCTLEPLPAPALPTEAHEITMVLNDESFRLRWRPHVTRGLAHAIDAGLFNAYVTAPIFGVTDLRTDTRVEYVPGQLGLRGVLDLVQRRPDRVGFFLYGLTPDVMFGVVDAGGIMPPKSTWYEPRMRNGLIVQEV